ncbi:hypothetical protein [Kiloniella sp.]|uniref:hypothetical protein n=1 Tax=Kiloniella sp. TaxID=1938587 RepID=UPI003B02580F
MPEKINIRGKLRGDISPRLNARHPLFALIAALSLILQLIVPLEQSWANPTLDPDADLTDVFIICTPTGLRILSLNSGEEGQPIESNLDISCPACSLASVTIAPLPVSDPISQRYDITNLTTWLDYSDPAFIAPSAPPPVRGPPQKSTFHTQILVLLG